MSNGFKAESGDFFHREIETKLEAIRNSMLNPEFPKKNIATNSLTADQRENVKLSFEILKQVTHIAVDIVKNMNKDKALALTVKDVAPYFAPIQEVANLKKKLVNLE